METLERISSMVEKKQLSVKKVNLTDQCRFISVMVRNEIIFFDARSKKSNMTSKTL